MSNKDECDASVRGTAPPTGSRVNLACAIAAFGAFLYGYDVGTFGGGQIFVREHFQMVPMVFGLVASALMLGCLLATTGGIRI